MPRKIKNVTKDYLVSIPLPNHADTYTVISYQSVIDYAYAELAAQGFGIVDEEYRCTLDGQIAQGIYKLQYNTDPEMCIMFTWTNSYNKQIKFKCAIGGYVNANGTVMLLGEIGAYVRKHSGTADADTIASMKSQIANADMYYNQLLQDKDKMKEINLSSKRQAELLGILFAEYEILNTEQASIVKQQMNKPSFFYNGGNDTMWAFYNHVTYALQQSHPRSWMEDQRMLHWVITNEVEFNTPVIEEVVSVIEDPLENNYGQPENQTNLLTQIAEVTGDESVLEPQLSNEIEVFSKAQLTGVKAPESIAQEIKESNPDLYHGLSHLAKAEEDMLVHGDTVPFEKIKEVTEQALKDELIFGISGVAVSTDGLRNVPIDEVLAKMQESDNQVIQEKVISAEILHQSEEIIEDTNEAKEVPFDIDADDDLVLDVILTPCVGHDAETEKHEAIELTEELVAETIAPMFEERVDETVTYTDPVGNTFEAPVVQSLEPTAEDVEVFEREQREDFFAFDLDFNLDDDDDVNTNDLYL